MATDADGDSSAMKMAEDIPVVSVESSSSATRTDTMADLDSQPLEDLGVNIMDQDVLERNVAAQVCICR